MDWERVPASKPPPGVVPNFQNPSKNNTAAYAVLTVCLVLSIIAMATRVVSRAFVVRKVFLTDVLLCAAFVLHVTMIAIGYKLAQSPGYFIHQWDVNMVQLNPFLKNVFLAVNIFCAYMGLIKSAILVEWLRIFVPRGTRNPLFYILHAVLWGNLLFYAIIIVLQNIACTPHAYMWDRTIPGGSCTRVNTAVTDAVSAIINLVVDVVILVIPQHVIWKLNMSSRKRFGVAVLFVIGFLAVVSAAGRVYATVYKLKAGGDDFVHDFAYVIMAALAEDTCAILVVCGPTMPKAVKAVHSAVTSEIPLVVRSWFSRSGAESWGRSGAGGGRSGRGSDDVPVVVATAWPGGFKAGAYANMEEHSLQSVTKSNSSSRVMESKFERAGEAERGILRSTEYQVTVGGSPPASEGNGNGYYPS